MTPSAGPDRKGPRWRSGPTRERRLGPTDPMSGGGHSVAGKALTHGGPVIDLRRMNAASVDPEAREVAARLLALGPEGEMIVELPYAQMQCLLDDPPGYRNYCSAEYLDAFPDEVVDRFCARARDMIILSPSQHVIIPQGGAIARGSSDYPIPWRKASWCAHPFGLWEDPGDDERGRRWAHDLCADLKPWASGAVYLNFIGDEGENRVVAGFGWENYQRLAQVKAQYDPDNVFHLNHNIKPASVTPRPRSSFQRRLAT